MTDNERFIRCWTRAQPVISSFIGSLVPDFYEAEDLLQEISVVIVRRFSTYDPKREFIAWALGIAKLEILAKRRTHARCRIIYDSTVMDRIEKTYVEISPELERRSEALKKCIEFITGRARDALRLRYEQAVKPAEIATRMGLNANTVRVLLSRVRASLRKCVESQLVAEGKRA